MAIERCHQNLTALRCQFAQLKHTGGSKSFAFITNKWGFCFSVFSFLLSLTSTTGIDCRVSFVKLSDAKITPTRTMWVIGSAAPWLSASFYLQLIAADVFFKAGGEACWKLKIILLWHLINKCKCKARTDWNPWPSRQSNLSGLVSASLAITKTL